MTYQGKMSNIIAIIQDAISLALNEPKNILSVEIHELTKTEQKFKVIGTFKVVPLFTTRTGRFNVTIMQSEKGLEIMSLKIDGA